MKGIRILFLKLMLKVNVSVLCIKSHGCSLSLIAVRQSVMGSQPGGREPTLKINLKLKMKNHDFSIVLCSPFPLPPIIGMV